MRGHYLWSSTNVTKIGLVGKWIVKSRERRSSKNARNYIPSPQSGDKGGYVCENVVLEIMLEH
jgi:hypothetical protein